MFEIGTFVQTVDKPHRYGKVEENFTSFNGQLYAVRNGSEIRYYEASEIEKATLFDRFRGVLEKMAIKFAGVEDGYY